MKTRLLVFFLIGLYKVEGRVIHEEPALCDLTLQKDGNIVEDGEVVMGRSGDLNQVYCKALCSGPGPTPALRWSKQDGTSIPEFRSRVYQLENTFDHTNVLTIRNMLYIDQGNYTCRGWLRHSGWVEKSIILSYGCPYLYHMCDTSRCFSNTHVCDGKANCRDGTDEKNCGANCQVGEFDCGDGECIPVEQKCDGLNQCVSGADEPAACCANGFLCWDGECIDDGFLCDGILDCRLGEDELINCSPFKVFMTDTRLEVTEGMLAAFECYLSPLLDQRNYETIWSRKDGELPATSEIRSVDGRSVLTLDKVTISDNGTYLCEVTDGNTTESATGELIVTTYCGEGKFHCGGAECVPKSSVCNGTNDCSNGTDENECPFKVLMAETRLEVTVGTLAGFGCYVSPFLDKRNYEFTWSREDGERLPPGEITSLVDRSVLILDYITIIDNGTYVCEVTDGKTTQSATSELIVTYCDSGLLCLFGGCVAQHEVCDDTPDCPDGEDESNCTYCDEGEFHCGGAECIPQTSVCNGANDCSNGTDENECPFKVLMVDTRLEVTEGMLAAFECYVSPFSDQLNYKFTWSRKDGELPATSEIRSVDGRSVLTLDEVTISDNGTYLCEVTDGKTTESAAGELIVTRCVSAEFNCNDGTCINNSTVCDYVPDCANGEDEANCEHEVCPAGRMRCPDGSKCIDLMQICDGTQDCDDNYDEISYCFPAL